MNKRRIGLAAAIGLAVTAMVGVPRVTAQDDPAPQSSPGAATAAEAAGAGDLGVTHQADPAAETNAVRTATGDGDLEYVVLGTPCRVFDTRIASGPLVNNVTRTYSVVDEGDANFTNVQQQGGNPAGCNIPFSAVAVNVSLSTLYNSPTGAGFVRVGEGNSTPTATVLQFLPNQGVSATTNTVLNGSYRFALRSSGGNTGMVGDVLGYYEVTMHASVRSNGTLERGLAGVSKSATVAGSYVVTFFRDISKCTPIAVSGTTTSPGLIATSLNGPRGEVFVRTLGEGNVSSDKAFRLTVEC